MKTKVWIAIWGLKDGGAEVLARTYASMVDKQKFDATVVTMYPFKHTANYRYTKEAGIRVLSVYKRRNMLSRVQRVLFGKWYIPYMLKKMLSQEKPDTIHFNSQLATWFTALRQELSSVRLLYTCHSEPQKYFSPKETQAVRQLIEEHGLRMIALHENMKTELDQLFSRKDTVVVRNGVDFRRFYNSKCDPRIIRKNLGIAQDAYVVGHVGRFIKVKNHSFLLKVFQELLQKKPNAHLLLVGSGDLKDQITQTVAEQHLENHVTILSHRTDIPDLLRAMDVLVFPSFYEGLSVALVEAQTSGLKCVVSDTINPANFLSEKTIPVSLDASAETWAQIVLNDDVRNENHGNIEAYDMNREIHRLERLYRGELDV